MAVAELLNYMVDSPPVAAEIVKRLTCRTLNENTTVFLKSDSTVIVVSYDRSLIENYKQLFADTGNEFELMTYNSIWGIETAFPDYNEALEFYNNLI